MRGRLFSIAPHAPFLQTLAEKVCDGTLLGDWDISTPFGLSDVTIILPTRRAAQALGEAFASRLGGTALLPDLRTFGGEPEEEEPFLPPFDAPALPPSADPLDRKLRLAQLIEAWLEREQGAEAHPGISGFASPPSPAEILMLAESLGQLIDDCLVEGVQLDGVAKLDPGDKSGHWQSNLKFLEIALSYWPAELTELGHVDAAARRNLQLERQAETLPQIYGGRPVIAAGSTGSIPATARLLKAIVGLPRGILVLPGLDTVLPSQTRTALADPKEALHGHAQFGLNQLLQRLGAQASDVEELASKAHPRTALVRHALARPDDIALWAAARDEGMAMQDEALSGLAIAVARTDEEQARAIALAARQALADGLTVGIISPDRNLARRIAAELQRFDVSVDDSAGTPLFQSRAGRVVRLCVAAASSDFAPVDLMALLRHPATALGLGRPQVRAAADALEYGALRGQRPGRGLSGLREAVAANLSGQIRYPAAKLTADAAEEIDRLLDALHAALDPLCTLLRQGKFTVPAFAEALHAALGAITTDPGDAAPFPDMIQLRDWLARLAGETAGPVLASSSVDAALSSLMAGQVVRPMRPGRDDIAIWGQLEARLQNPGLMILAGLSEGIWPEAADPGPWLNRAMRLELGLMPPERRQGQAAHDFEMAMGNAHVLIARAERSGSSPATPSRLLQRLEAFIGAEATKALQARGAHWVDAARNLDFSGKADPAIRPVPRPPIALRPRRLSVTEIEALIRSPYDIHARHVLRLRPVAPLGEDPDLSERGSLVHEVFGRFISEGHDPLDTKALPALLALAAEIFSAIDTLPERRVMWTARFRPMAEKFLAFERARSGDIALRKAELSGQMTLSRPDGDFTLSGRADRIDVRRDGRLEIIDFKTGAPPDNKEMMALTAPQLLLEAAMAARGGFEGVPDADAALMLYVKLGFGPEPWTEKSFKLPEGLDAPGAASEAISRLSRHVDEYLYRDTALAAAIFPKPGQRYAGDYDHLARLAEWANIEGGEEG